MCACVYAGDGQSEKTESIKEQLQDKYEVILEMGIKAAREGQILNK